MNHSRSTFVGAAFAAVMLSAGTSLGQFTWNGGDVTWTNPDSDSFGAGTYTDGNTVTFDDTPGIVQDILLGTDVSPGSMTFENETVNYVIRSDNGGVGATDPPTTIFAIRGGGAVTQSGPAAVSFVENNAAPFAFGDLAINGGVVYFRVDQRGLSHDFDVGLGTGTVTLNDGTTFKINLIEGGLEGTDKRQFNLTNALNLDGAVVLEIARSGGYDAGGNSDDFSVRFTGAIALAGESTYFASTGGGGQNGGHGIEGLITIDQTVAGNRALLRGTGEGNQQFTIASRISDGAGGAGNALRLSNSSGSAPRRVFWEAAGSWSGGTRILDVGVTEAEAGVGQVHAIDVQVGATLGLGNVFVERGGLLTLQHGAAIDDRASLTIEAGGYVHVVDGVTERVAALIVDGVDLGAGLFGYGETSAIQGGGLIQVVDAPIQGLPRITSFSYDAGSGSMELRLRGEGSTSYRFTGSQDLDFTGAAAIVLTGATLGTITPGTGGTQVTTTAEGLASVQCKPGTGRTGFVRAETP